MKNPQVLKSTIYVKDHLLIFLIDNEMFKVDVKKAEFKKMKMRKSKVPGRNKILTLSQTSETQILCLSEEFCLRALNITTNEKDDIFKSCGFLCPFCLRLFCSQFSLYRDHIDVHKGPLVCEICKVSEKTITYLLALFSSLHVFTCMGSLLNMS